MSSYMLEEQDAEVFFDVILEVLTSGMVRFGNYRRKWLKLFKPNQNCRSYLGCVGERLEMRTLRIDQSIEGLTSLPKAVL